MLTDRGSLIYEIGSKDVYKELFKQKQFFVFSEYQSNFFDLTNKKYIGKMKDEHKKIPINESVGLKPKMRFILSENDKESNKAKGVNIGTEFNECKEILFKRK